MPYIPQDERTGIDALIDPLAEALNGAGGNDAMVGRLNYAVSRLAWRLCGHGSGERRYARMNAVCGALAMALQEFYRRIAAPYEDEKVAQAGDVGVLRSPGRAAQQKGSPLDAPGWAGSEDFPGSDF